jgi:hypothetical protein
LPHLGYTPATPVLKAFGVRVSSEMGARTSAVSSFTIVARRQIGKSLYVIMKTKRHSETQTALHSRLSCRILEDFGGQSALRLGGCRARGSSSGWRCWRRKPHTVLRYSGTCGWRSRGHKAHRDEGVCHMTPSLSHMIRTDSLLYLVA